MKKLLQTNNDLTFTVMRLALGFMMFPHGAQKMLGWFGGQGFSATMDGLTHKMQLPAPLALMAILAEFLGGLGLITGTLTRVSAFGVGTVMAVAALKVHLANGFFMNWFGQQKGEGVEFFILAIGLAVAVLVKGAGAFSIDGVLARLFSQSKPVSNNVATAV